MANTRQDLYTIHNNADLMSRPQEHEMYSTNEYHRYRPQGNNSKICPGQNSAPHYGVPPMTDSPLSESSVITLQPGSNAGQITPSDQRINRTTSSESITCDENKRPQSKLWVIFKRMISVVFMVADLVMAWIQLSEMGHADDDVEFDLKKVILSCPQSQPVIVTYIVIMCFSTLYTIMQIVNVIGETIYDITNTTKRKRGFQVVHGFIEVVIKVGIKDIPQLILIFISVFFKCKCTSKMGRWFKFIGVLFAQILSSTVRTQTCKQEEKPPRKWECDSCCSCDTKCCCSCDTKCCQDECRCCPDEYRCCPDECGCECLCLCCYLPISTKKFNRCVPISICRYLGCFEKGCCKCDWAPRGKNPEFAEKTLSNLYNYWTILLFLNIIAMILRCDISFSLFAMIQ